MGTQTSPQSTADKKTGIHSNIFLGGTLLCVVLWAIGAGIAWENYVNERQKSQHEIIDLGNQISHHSLIIFKNANNAIDQSVKRFSNNWDELTQNRIAAHDLLSSTFAGIYDLEDVRLITPNGQHIVTYKHRFEKAGSKIPGYLHPLVLRELISDQKQMNISPLPYKGAIALSHPVYDKSGSLRAYLLARINTGVLEDMYSSTHPDSRHQFAILDQNGFLLSSHEGMKIPDIIESFKTGSERQYALPHCLCVLTKVPGYDLVILTRSVKSVVYANWKRHTVAYGVIGVIFTIFILTYSFKILRTLARARHENMIRRETERDLIKLSQAVEQSPVSVVITDKDANIEYVNHTFTKITGYEPDEVIGQNPRILHANEEDVTDYESLWATLLAGHEWRGEFHNKRKDDTTFWERATLSPIKDENGSITHFLGVKEDITDKKEIEDQLQMAATVFETAAEAIMVCNGKKEIETVNSSFTEITGYQMEEVIGKTPALLKSGHHNDEFYQNMLSKLEMQGQWEGEIWNRRKNGDIYPQWLSIKAIFGDNGTPIRYISLFTDITLRKSNEERILFQANYDALTNLPNRSLFMDRLKQAVISAERSNTQIALLFIDLDRFKNVNDSLGHACGDMLLKEASSRLTDLVRKSDTVARLGGDEFTVILQDLSDFTQIESIVDKMLHSLAEPFDLNGNIAFVSASIGITIFPNDARSIEDLLKNADTAMYQAKENGRNLSQFFTKKMNEQARERRDLETALHQALEREEFVLHYQPIIHAETGQLASCEVLLRWHQPEHGNIFPDTFIPLAEDTGLILPIGEWVLRKACYEAKIWESYCQVPPKVSINMSSKQFQRTNVAALVKTILAETDLSPHRLNLEITESLLIADDDLIIEQLYGLRDLGVGLSIDDFGTGYSSLSYLRRFPITTLKIDRAFILDLPNDAEAVALVSAILSLAESLKLDVVAEGVETEEQLAKLRADGCGYIQGYFYSPPVPIEAFRLLVKQNGPLDPDE
ncbi:EAL domain-containing protein [Terasakiella sp. A23]|uniref:bifunctional diguanylate cyclase/phosphodiesterase n=1 Tax=Terasakiella sp. FCG-A23 TaxID=3080561 RepID=UPI002955AC8D|nr:EAL domain-containing protein [Terasakiella sp. A23]MDV7341120.1 EAL domain-containing protein [Terasakiella sp. A23]